MLLRPTTPASAIDARQASAQPRSGARRPIPVAGRGANRTGRSATGAGVAIGGGSGGLLRAGRGAAKNASGSR